MNDNCVQKKYQGNKKKYIPTRQLNEQKSTTTKRFTATQAYVLGHEFSGQTSFVDDDVEQSYNNQVSYVANEVDLNEDNSDMNEQEFVRHLTKKSIFELMSDDKGDAVWLSMILTVCTSPAWIIAKWVAVIRPLQAQGNEEKGQEAADTQEHEPVVVDMEKLVQS